MAKDNMTLGFRKTILVHGRMALRTERLRLAREGASGVQVMAIEHFAERLAGGFLKMVDNRTLKRVIGKILPETNIGELEPIKDLPGMTAAAADTLMKLWLSEPDFENNSDHKRIQSIIALETAVINALPAHLRRPNDIIEIAIKRAKHAPSIFGDVSMSGMTELHPVWRPLIDEVSKYISIEWNAGPREVSSWIENAMRVNRCEPTNPEIQSYICGTALHEVIEAVRWSRKLMSEGVLPRDIAIASVSTTAYDEHMLAVCSDSKLGFHFAHGISCVHRIEGQAASALADVLLRGLSQKRVQRLFDLLQGIGSEVVKGLPGDWSRNFRPDAALTELSRWEKTLNSKPQLAELKNIMLPVLTLISKGINVAPEAGEKLFHGQTKKIWEAALLEGPAAALDRTIPVQRIDDGEDPHSSACFMSAEKLAASPRPYVRLIGLTSRDWPRQSVEDALIPDYIIPSSVLDPLPRSDIDRRDYNTIKATTEKLLILSWPRRDAESRQLGVSRLVTQAERDSAKSVQLTDRPEHAFSEADRLFARDKEYATTTHALSAAQCWSNWRSKDLTAHDGVIPPNHPRIMEVFNQYHSATSIRLLLRDPIGFVWRYALGFSAPEYEDAPLFADPREFGNIVHDILKQTVDQLIRKGGFVTASTEDISRTIDEQSINVGMRVEMSKPIPPKLIWFGMMERATQFAKKALLSEIERYPDQVTFAEVPFGGKIEIQDVEFPWDIEQEVTVPGTGIKLQGIIDRLDYSTSSPRARVIDYKTGKTPKNIDDIIIDGGNEIQRAIYGFVVKSLMGGNAQVETGLLYPETGVFAILEEPEEVLTQVANGISIAKESLKRGNAIPGIGTSEAFNDMRFALPANAAATYLLRKNQTFLDRIGDAADIWEYK